MRSTSSSSPFEGQSPINNNPVVVSILTKPETLTEEALAKQLTLVRRTLHQRPEVGFAEHDTTAYLQEFLKEHGFTIGGRMAGTGFFIEIEGTHPGPTIGYRTELDALPADDAKSVDYASVIPGAAHLCGHDAHMAIALGVALLLNERRELLHGRVRIIFQPNEENIPTGAPHVIASGVIEGLREILCVHSDPSLDVGRVGLRAGAVTAATASWMVCVVSGQAGHSARPHETVDTVWLAHQILNAFYQLPGRIHDARRPAVLTACRFEAGRAINVIPSEVAFGGTLRSPDIESLRFLSGRMGEVAEQYGQLHKAEVRYEADLGLPGVVNDPLLIDVVRNTASDLLGSEAVYQIPEPSMGGEDFAYYLEHIPGALIRIGTRGSEATSYPLHHSQFDIDERALPLAAQLMTEVLTRRLARIVEN